MTTWTLCSNIIFIALALTGIVLVWQRRDIISLGWEGFWFYPESKLVWGSLARRLSVAVAEGVWFYLRCKTVDRNINYGDHQKHRLDVFSPADAAGRPVLFFVHGGGWSGGLKEQYPAMAREFIKLGYVVVLVNHRLYPEVRFPAFIEDVASALRWVVDNISQYGGDPKTIFLAGQSAGAHTVALLGLDDHYIANQKIDKNCIKGVIGASGPYDILSLIAHMHEGLNLARAEKYLSSIMGGKDKLEIASPLRQVHPDAPPFLILHGKQDLIVPYQISKEMAGALDRAGVETHLEIMENVDHFSMVLNLFGRMQESSSSAVKEIDRFCRLHF
ncbi:MAG: alpha/beta hydrolase [Anaerolineales bacterium]|nr:alpha/beta hydrolase [Anaerolineales bacterium]